MDNKVSKQERLKIFQRETENLRQIGVAKPESIERVDQSKGNLSKPDNIKQTSLSLKLSPLMNSPQSLWRKKPESSN